MTLVIETYQEVVLIYRARILVTHRKLDKQRPCWGLCGFPWMAISLTFCYLLVFLLDHPYPQQRLHQLPC